MPGPDPRPETIATVVRVLGDVARTLAMIDLDAVEATVRATPGADGSERVRVLALVGAGRAFTAALNPPQAAARGGRAKRRGRLWAA
jgi:hypothetical protein